MFPFMLSRESPSKIGVCCNACHNFHLPKLPIGHPYIIYHSCWAPQSVCVYLHVLLSWVTKARKVSSLCIWITSTIVHLGGGVQYVDSYEAVLFYVHGNSKMQIAVVNVMTVEWNAWAHGAGIHLTPEIQSEFPVESCSIGLPNGLCESKPLLLLVNVSWKYIFVVGFWVS